MPTRNIALLHSKKAKSAQRNGRLSIPIGPGAHCVQHLLGQLGPLGAGREMLPQPLPGLKAQRFIVLLAGIP